MLLLYMLAIVHITFSVCVNLKERGTTDVFVFIQCPEELRRVALNFSALVATIVMDISPFHPDPTVRCHRHFCHPDFPPFFLSSLVLVEFQ